MGDLSDNLSRYEMACNCGCGFDTVDFDLVHTLQDAVDHFALKYGDCKVIITGPNRCPTHNKANGGAPNSQHLYGKAADHKLYVNGDQIDPREVYDYYDKTYPRSHGVGLYHNRVHVDVRKTKARWGA